MYTKNATPNLEELFMKDEQIPPGATKVVNDNKVVKDHNKPSRLVGVLLLAAAITALAAEVQESNHLQRMTNVEKAIQRWDELRSEKDIQDLLNNVSKYGENFAEIVKCESFASGGGHYDADRSARLCGAAVRVCNFYDGLVYLNSRGFYDQAAYLANFDDATCRYRRQFRKFHLAFAEHHNCTGFEFFMALKQEAGSNRADHSKGGWNLMRFILAQVW